MSDRLSHVGESGEARMVDVSAKGETTRIARASGVIRMRAETLEAIRSNQLKKGDVLAVARVAGIMAAKRTSELIPLCHQIPLHDVQIEFFTNSDLPGIRAESVAKTVGRTGVEMEALTAVAIALLTIYDMAKAMDRAMEISDISLEAKSGGRSGDWSRG